MPAVTRELSVTYGGATLGGSSSANLLEMPYEIDITQEQVSFRGFVTVVGSTEALFEDACTAIELAFRTINGALVITFGSEVHFTGSHSANTFMLARPTIRKSGDDASGRARRYEVSVVGMRPSDAHSSGGKVGLREAKIEVTTTPSRLRTYRVTGPYTATATPATAVAQYEAQIATLMDTIEAGLTTTGAWKRGGHQYERDDENKIVRITRSAIEQPSAALNNAGVFNQRIAVAKTLIAPGDTGAGVARLVEAVALFEADIDYVAQPSLTSIYDGTIRTWLLAHARSVLGSSAVALIQEAPNYDTFTHRISVVMRLLAVAGSSVLSRRTQTRIEDYPGIDLWPVWTGNPFAKVKFQGPARRVRTTTTQQINLGGPTSSAGGGGDAFAGFHFAGSPGIAIDFSRRDADLGPRTRREGGGQGDAERWTVLYAMREETPLVVGLAGATIEVLETLSVVIEEYSEDAGIPGGDGGVDSPGRVPVETLPSVPQ